ncbi:MAG: nucleotidyltransferase family protein [Salinivirgaceae bacterium]|nr:nucleotidyltransferase family protein [Salinivirgaceae bacterium]
MTTKAMIFSAGIGSRLKPITNNIPKALVEVSGKTLLQINIEKLIGAGVTDIVVNVHHFAEQIKSYLEQNKNFGVSIKISDESDLLIDTGGGLKKAAPLFGNCESIIIQNVDIYSTINYHKLIEYHYSTNSLATLAIKNRTSSRHLLFDENMELGGWRNNKTDEEIIIKPEKELIPFAFSGIHVIKPELLKLLPNEKAYAIIPIYLELAKNNLLSGYLHNDDTWFDIGTPQKLKSFINYLE